MYCSGVSFLLELIAASHRVDTDSCAELSAVIIRNETEEHRGAEDIVRLPLKLPFPALPLIGISKNDTKHNIQIVGPEGNENLIHWEGNCGRSISTYPTIIFNIGEPNESIHRDGNPICDRFLVQMFPQRIIAIVADGCNWGDKPKTAAKKASDSFLHYLMEHQAEATTTHYVARLITRAFSLAHHSILKGAEDLWDVGTTTLLGGILVQLEQPLLEDRDGDIVSCNWAYIWGSVGDCKGFHYSHKTKKIRDITSANRLGTSSSRDCGGRLGPAGSEGLPDLRNFRIDLTPCEEGDILILVSDGVHDNLEPLQIGLSPKEVGIEAEMWEDVEPQRRGEIAAEYSIYLLNNLLWATENGIPEEPIVSEDKPHWKDWKLPFLEIFSDDDPDNPALHSDDISCAKIVQRLMNHCLATNRNAAMFMQNNPSKKLPKDYQLYPGKMDHTTCVAIRVEEHSKLMKKASAVKRKNTKNQNMHTGRRGSASVNHTVHSNEGPIVYPSLEPMKYEARKRKRLKLTSESLATKSEGATDIRKKLTHKRSISSDINIIS